MKANPFESQLERLARTLTEQFGVQVVCQGDQAWTDGSRIVVPSVPEPLTRRAGDARGREGPRPGSEPASQGEPSYEALERMMIGYLDHELAHVAFSDFEVAAEFEKRHPGFLGMLNVIEDALIERRAMERWPGVRRNLDRMFEQIRPRVRELIAQRGPFDRFCTAVYLRLDGATQYRPFTREHDTINVLPPADPAEVSMLLETGRDTVRRLRRGLTNALRSAEKRWWRQDQLRGELSPRTLHRLCMDRPRLDVFRVRSTVQGQSTAVSILLDASGSMSRRKMDVARDAMRVLIEALADLKVPTEALTFTTGNAMDISETMRQTGLDARKLREHYGRLSNLEIGLVQQFGESARTALSRLPSVHGSGLTPLGEAMQIAAARLVSRRETRRILLVLTDGKAGCEGGSEAATIHAQEMATRITKIGIELIGVGILDDNIRDVVAESIVIQTLEDLPAQLCKLLGRTLMRGVRRVG